MKQIHFYINGIGEHLKDWPNWTGEVPQTGDMVALHFGDNYEEERAYIVKLRAISGTKPDSVKLFIEPINE